MFTKLSDDSKLGILTAFCQFPLAIMFKNIFHVHPDIFTGYAPVMIFLIYIFSKDFATEYEKPLYWGIAIIFVTLTTVILYTFF